MGDEILFIGTWKIMKCHSLTSRAEADNIVGCMFDLAEGGDVKWTIVDKVNCERMPFFECETYEIYFNDCSYYLRLYGIHAGYSLEFKVEQPREDAIDLTYEGWCSINCERHSISPSESLSKHNSIPFSFLGAFEEGFFSDLVIKANTGFEFHVHKLILHLANPTLDWYSEDKNSTLPLQGLPENVLRPLIHYLYSESLPTHFTEEIARDCINTIEKHKLPGFEKFIQLCNMYIRNSGVKKRIFGLIQEMHDAAKAEIHQFSKGQVEIESGCQSGARNRFSKLIFNLKHAAGEATVIGVKFLIVCNLYSQHRNHLTLEEQEEIMQHCKRRLPFAMSQIHQLFDLVKQTIHSLTTSDRIEFASNLVPEYENFSSLVPQLTNTVETTMAKLIEINDKICYELSDMHFHHGFVNSSSTKSNGDESEDINSTNHDHSSTNIDVTIRRLSVSEALSRSLKLALHIKELKSLRNLYYICQQFSENLLSRRENFAKMTISDKMRCLVKTVEQFAEEIPMILVKVDDLATFVSERSSWKEWKYLFKVITAKVVRVLSKLRQHKDILQPFLTLLCDMVGKDQFIQGLIELELLENYKKPELDGDTNDANSITQTSMNVFQSFSKTENHEKIEINDERKTSYHLFDKPEDTQYPLKSLFQSPPSTKSFLSQRALSLLNGSSSKRNLLADDTTSVAMVPDLLFEVYPPKVPLSRSSSLCSSSGSRSASFEEEQQPIVSNSDYTNFTLDVKPVIIASYRVILASRCDWFKRALLSGMKESINKTIRVYDTEPNIFRLFLEYLYSGQLQSKAVGGVKGSICQISPAVTLQKQILSVDDLCELLQLSDRYQVDCLKHRTESLLVNLVDDESALYLLALSDRFNAKYLKRSTVGYVTTHKELLSTELFLQLPLELQAEIEEILMWNDINSSRKLVLTDVCNTSIATRKPHLRNSNFNHRITCLPSEESPLSLSSSIADMNDLQSSMSTVSGLGLGREDGCENSEFDAFAGNDITCHPQQQQQQQQPTLPIETPQFPIHHISLRQSESFEGVPLTQHESESMEQCIQSLIDILGDDVSREELVRISIAADYDINRAVNYYLP